MKTLLTLKSWQIFLLVWGIPFLTMFIPLESMSSTIIILLTFIMGLTSFLWLYSIGTYLPEKLDKSIKLNSNLFKTHIWISFILIILASFSYYFKEFILNHIGAMFLVVVYYFIVLLIVFRYVSRLIASIELQRLAKISDYIGYVFLFWFSPIGIWIIQPKIRKLYI